MNPGKRVGRDCLDHASRFVGARIGDRMRCEGKRRGLVKGAAFAGALVASEEQAAL